MKTNVFPTLAQVLGCYFHQDWNDEFLNESEVISTVLKEIPESEIAASILEIDLLLRDRNFQKNLDKVLLEEIGCYFDPRTTGLSYVNWLSDLKKQFTDNLAK